MFFLIFLAAAALVVLGLRVTDGSRLARAMCPEGLCFVLGTAVVGFAGLCYLTLWGEGAALARNQVSPALVAGAQLWILAVGIYVLSALRGAAGFPAWVADLIVLGAAYGAIRADGRVLLSVSSSMPDSPALPLGLWAVPLTMGWIWMVARMCAALSRVPSVSGGFLGLLAGLIFLLTGTASATHNSFPPSAMAALAGAGLATFLMSLRFPHLNLGWSATLAMGFVLGVASALELLKNTLPAILALALLALGLPLLDVTLVQVRARLRGQSVEWSQTRQRLHEALASRGVAPRKIALLYIAIGLWTCKLAYCVSRWFFEGPTHPAVTLLYALIVVGWTVGGAIGFFSIARLLMRRVPGEDVPESIEAFGVKISPVSMGEALDKIEEFIARGTPHHVLTSDANAILTSRDDPDYAAIMRRAALITPDGFGVIWGARLLNLPIYERVTGVDMVTGICERAAKKGYRIYILGAAEGIASTAARNLSERYPGLQVVGTHHGFWRRDPKNAAWTAEDDAKMAQEIAAQNVDVLFVAMGIPSQEKFIAAQLECMKTPVALGVGGSFDVYAGKFNRAPNYVQRMGLEWLYRVWIDPSRWKRMGYVPKFMLVALKTWLSRPPKNGAKPASGAF